MTAFPTGNNVLKTDNMTFVVVVVVVRRVTRACIELSRRCRRRRVPETTRKTDFRRGFSLFGVFFRLLNREVTCFSQFSSGTKAHECYRRSFAQPMSPYSARTIGSGRAPRELERLEIFSDLIRLVISRRLSRYLNYGKFCTFRVSCSSSSASPSAVFVDERRFFDHGRSDVS